MMSNQAGLGLGDKVHTQEINEYPQDLKDDYLFLSSWVKSITKHYGREILVRVIDPQSLIGMWRLIRHRIRHYPTFILENEHRFVGWEAEPRLHSQIHAIMTSRGHTPPSDPFSMTPKIEP